MIIFAKMALMHRHWRYPNLLLLALSLILTGVILYNGWLEHILSPIHQWGYVGVFIIGGLFVSTFTVAPAAAVLFALSGELNPWFVSVTGGLGAMIGDYLAFRFIKDRIFAELNPFLKMLHLYRPVNILQTKYFAWLTPVVGALIVASPLPDEIGLSLLGLTKISTARLLFLAFLLNAIGILFIALAAKAGV